MYLRSMIGLRRVGLGSALAVVAVALAACSSSPKPSSTSTTTQQALTVTGPGGVLGGTNDTHTPAESLNGAGANSIQPFFQAAFYNFSEVDPGVKVSYSPAGSSVGISDIQQGTVDFGDTEIPMSSSDLAKASGTVLQIPVDLGGVAISYNLPQGPKSVKLDSDVLAQIYLGQITKWNDPAIAALNPGATLADLAVVPVHRSDSSGPGWDLDQYLILNSQAWAAKVGHSASKTWPVTTVGVGQQLNTGVATYIEQTPGAIGFVEYGYAFKAGLDSASLLSKNGQYVAPSTSSIAAAGKAATGLSADNFSIIEELGNSVYPLANFSWTLVQEKGTDESKQIALGKLIDYVVTTAQSSAQSLGYSPLPSNVAQLAIDTLWQMETPAGQPLFSH